MTFEEFIEDVALEAKARDENDEKYGRDDHGLDERHQLAVERQHAADRECHGRRDQ